MSKRRDLLIMSIDRTDVYELLKKVLGDNLEVILDRRRGERRSQSIPTTENRRRRERRSYDESYLLKTVGVIRVSAERRETAQDERSPPG